LPKWRLRYRAKIDGEDLLIVKESDVLGVIERSEARKAA
jgi:co-chaperonin GroES (HSP10)